MAVETDRESQNVERKESWKDAYLKVLCAFANAEGGTLYIGINDSGKVVGVNNAEKLLEKLPNKIRNRLGIIADVRLCTTEGKDYVSVEVPAYHYLVGFEGRYYKRTGSTIQELMGHKLSEALLKRRNMSWDSLTVPKVSVKNLSEKAFKIFREKCIRKQPDEQSLHRDTKERILRNLQLITDDGYLTHAAILLFHPQPHNFFTGATVQIGYFRSDADLVYQDVVSGALIEQVDKLEDIIYTKYLKAYVSYDGFQRYERFPLPKVALREAILNAIVHRDYASSMTIQIKVFDDQFVIYNPGKLPENWTVKDLTKRHYSCPYNPLIAGAFTKAGEMEKWGRGIEAMVQACKAAQLPMLKYEYKGSYALTFRMRNGDTASQATSSLPKSILALMKQSPTITRTQLADQLRVGVRTVDNHIRRFKSQGLIKRVGPDKGGQWVVKE